MSEMFNLDAGTASQNLRRRMGRSRRGNAVVFVGMMLPVMCGFIALAVDYGFLLYVRADLHKKADLSTEDAAIFIANTFHFINLHVQV